MKMLLGGQDVPFSISQQGFPAEKLLFFRGADGPALSADTAAVPCPERRLIFLSAGLRHGLPAVKPACKMDRCLLLTEQSGLRRDNL